MKRPARRGAGKLRIIGGSLRGSVLEVADAEGLRPTPARVRETLFNWLQPVIEGARCLDLFAGSGALGIEALSRGAAAVDFVERDAATARALEANLLRLKQAHGRVHRGQALDYLDGPGRPFDIVFLDPPFSGDLWAPVMQRLDAGGWLAPGALVHVEAPLRHALHAPARWTLHRERQAGDVRHALYRCAPADALD